MTSDRLFNRIAIHIQSEVQLFSIKPFAKALMENKYQVEILIQKYQNDKNLNSLAIKVYDLIVKHGMKPFYIEDLKPQKQEYDIYITPYIEGIIKAKCILHYEYGSLNVKPSETYKNNYMGGFDGFLSTTTSSTNLLTAYGKTFPVDNLRFFGKDIKKTKPSQKPRLLLAPTFNDCDTEEELAQALKKLKNNYHIISKGHHGTHYYNNNASKKSILIEFSDEYYGSETEIADLILSSDVCIFGNTSAIADAIYAEKPFVIFTKNPSYFEIEGIHPTQYYLVNHHNIPYAKTPNEILTATEKALSSTNQQKIHELKQQFFPERYRTGTSGYMKAIDFFNNNPEALDYLALKKIQRKSLLEAIEPYKQKLDACGKHIYELEEKLNDYSNRKLYRIADKYYNLRSKKK